MFSIIIRRSAFIGEKRHIRNIFLIIVIIVIFLENYIKTLLNSNKILSENVTPISGINLEIIG